jgi:hypothetical protein
VLLRFVSICPSEKCKTFPLFFFRTFSFRGKKMKKTFPFGCVPSSFLVLHNDNHHNRAVPQDKKWRTIRKHMFFSSSPLWTNERFQKYTIFLPSPCWMFFGASSDDRVLHRVRHAMPLAAHRGRSHTSTGSLERPFVPRGSCARHRRRILHRASRHGSGTTDTGAHHDGAATARDDSMFVVLLCVPNRRVVWHVKD